jgi:uncharacterized protein (TIGR03000 family)
MSKRWFPLVSAAALALMLVSAGTSRAQMIGWGVVTPWGGVGGWGYGYGGGGVRVYVGPVYDLVPSMYFTPTSIAYDPMDYVAFYPPLYSTRAPVAAPVPEPTVAPAVAVLPSTDQEAIVEVTAPADAVILFDGHKTTQTGTHRVFATPPLPTGQNYSYLVEATFQQDGKPVTQRQRVQVHAGGQAGIVFPLAK